ncbi:MAG: hypothetical protein WBN65_07945 [Gammaproteobacteria bacterium]
MLPRARISCNFDCGMRVRNVIGGFLMGVGATIVPGGDAALIVQCLPSLSLHALVAYLAMVAGIAMTLMLSERVMGAGIVVSCGGDFCTKDKTRPGTWGVPRRQVRTHAGHLAFLGAVDLYSAPSWTHEHE